MSRTVEAPGKINLCLFLGKQRPDGYHSLTSLVEPVSLADSISVRLLENGDGNDRVVCPTVDGPNLVSEALTRCRETGFDFPALELTVEKRIPVAAGMGGGSADAAAALRLVAEIAEEPLDARFYAIAEQLGADVPAQLELGPKLMTGVGERVESISLSAPHAFLIVPADFGLSTAAVYREADRLGLGRSEEELKELLEQARTAFGAGSLSIDLCINDLQIAALSLKPEIDEVLVAVNRSGADTALVSGSGPTVVGIFLGDSGLQRADQAAGLLQAGGYTRAVVAEPLAGDRSHS